MGVEYPLGVGASASARPSAHHRVCSGPPATQRASFHASSRIRTRVGVCSTRHGHLLESRSLHWLRLSSATRWDAPVPRRPYTSFSGAAQRSRWKPTSGVCSQYPRLPPLSAARTVPMEWQCDQKATPGQRAPASACCWFGPAAATRDWSRREHRRACLRLVLHQRVEVCLPPTTPPLPAADAILSRAQRAHTRLSWVERLTRNARSTEAGPITIKLFGVPEDFALLLDSAQA